MRIEKEMLDAALKGDGSASEYLADSYVFTGPNGVIAGEIDVFPA